MMDDNHSDEYRSQQMRIQYIKGCQVLTVIGLIGAPVSLLFGGVALSTVALVCSIIAYVRMRKIATPDDEPDSLERTLTTQSLVALILSIVAMILNIIAFVYMIGAIMEFLQTGDASSLANALGTMTQEGDAPTKSIWD